MGYFRELSRKAGSAQKHHWQKVLTLLYIFNIWFSAFYFSFKVWLITIHLRAKAACFSPFRVFPSRQSEWACCIHIAVCSELPSLKCTLLPPTRHRMQGLHQDALKGVSLALWQAPHLEASFPNPLSSCATFCPGAVFTCSSWGFSWWMDSGFQWFEQWPNTQEAKYFTKFLTSIGESHTCGSCADACSHLVFTAL